MGGAKNVKNAQWYELSIAAKLNSAPIDIGNGFLDITDFYFDPNHKSYPPEQTKAGYPAEIDITVIKANVQYNISCKFTERPSGILGPPSREFLEVLLEFMPLHSAEAARRLDAQMNYILATNHMIGTELLQIGNWEFSRYEHLSEKIKRFGKKKYGGGFNSNLFQADQLRLLLNRVYILNIGIDELEKLHEKSKEFQNAYAVLSRRLLNIPRQGQHLHEVISVDVTILCHSTDHSKCYDLAIEDRICHVGSLNVFQRKLERRLREHKDELIKKISAKDVGLTTNDIVSHRSMSPEGISNMLNIVLNKKELLKSQYVFYVLPVTLGILAFGAFDLAQRIKETRDEYDRVHPARLKEINALELGEKALEQLTQLAYLNGFGYKLPSNDIIIDSKKRGKI